MGRSEVYTYLKKYFYSGYIKNSESYAKRWRRTLIDSIIREDLLDLENVRDIKSVEIMVELLRERVGSTTSFTSLANALLRELHLLEDITGSRISLNYIRDREKNEVDFLAVIDNIPVLLVEVKHSDNSFSRSLFRFRKMLPSVKGYQIVMNLKERKSKDGIKMERVSEFLNNLNFLP